MIDNVELQKLEDILESISDGFLSLDRKFNVIYLNKEAEVLFRLTKEIMIGNNFFALRPQACGTKLHENLLKAMNSQDTFTFSHLGILTGKYYEVKAYPTTNGISLYFQNITERRKAEETLLELVSIVECSNDAIISGTLDGKIKSFNQGAQETYGYSSEEIMNKHLSILFAPGENISEEILKKLSQGERINNMQVRHLKRNGEIIIVLLALFPISDNNFNIKGFSIIARDITEYKKMEQEIARLDRLNSIGQMAAGVGHEIRNPMTTVKGFLQLLQNRKQYQNDREFFELMIQEIDRANSIIKELLSLGKTKIFEAKILNLNEVLREIYPLLLADAINSNKDIELELGDIPNFIMDENDIRQIIFNLVRNGMEAMEPGGKIIIKTFQEEKNLVLAVIDEGSGIDLFAQKNIGTPFFTTKEQGTGLGLAVCHSIINRYNGKIDYDTSPLGTTFFVRFRKSF